MTILLHELYLVKVTTKEERIKIHKSLTTWFMNDPLTRIVSCCVMLKSVSREKENYTTETRIKSYSAKK